jgi:hypothetical protein
MQSEHKRGVGPEFWAKVVLPPSFGVHVLVWNSWCIEEISFLILPIFSVGVSAAKNPQSLNESHPRV